MRTSHVLTIKVAVEQLEQGDGGVAREEVRIAVESAMNLLQELRRRKSDVKSVVLEPLQLLERLEREQDLEDIG